MCIRDRRLTVWYLGELDNVEIGKIANTFYDKMTESLSFSVDELIKPRVREKPRKLQSIRSSGDSQLLYEANRAMGLALNDEEIVYLIDSYNSLNRDPTDVELMMFAQANSEHCRHKIFNASWIGEEAIGGLSLFDMIRNTYKEHPNGVLSAYSDNAAVTRGYRGNRMLINSITKYYEEIEEEVHIAVSYTHLTLPTKA